MYTISNLTLLEYTLTDRLIIQHHQSFFPNIMTHISVLFSEIIEVFNACQLQFFVDGTVGLGGHAHGILEAHPEIELYLGVDQDPAALDLASQNLKQWGKKIVLKHGNFQNFDLYLN